jgi:hypothetical protein
MDLFVGRRLQMPALRDRQQDIEALARLALRRAGRDVQIEPAAMEWLKRRRWDGNVLEFMRFVGARAKSCLGNEVVVADLEIDSALVSTPAAPAGLPLVVAAAQSEEESARTEKRSANVFKQQPSRMWHVVFNGDDLGTFPHTVGMQYVAFLLSRSGEQNPISAADLYFKINPAPSEALASNLDNASDEELAEHGLSSLDGKTSGGNVLDERYKADLHKGQQLLQAELDAARQSGDVVNVMELKEKLEKLRKVRFSQSKQRGRGSKSFQDPAHNDHTRIANALDTCFKKLGTGKGQGLARHLRNSIKRRGGFAYVPDAVISWET